MRAAVLGLGIVAPGAAGCAAFGAQLAQPAQAPLKVQAYGDEADPKAKRLPRLDRMTLAAAREALGAAPREGLSVVFGTGYGGLQATVDFLEGVAVRGNAFGSPTAFHQSVHHAPLGQLSIALQIHGACLTASDRELSGESALKVGWELLASGRAERVLVVAADEIVPALVSAYDAFGLLAAGVRPAEGAAAVLLGRQGPSDLWLESVAVTGHPCGSLKRASRQEMARLLVAGAATCGASALVSPAVCGLPSDSEELAALAQVLPEAERVNDEMRVGFNPSGGLLRLVAMALRLRAAGNAGRGGLIHGLAPGGGQAVTVLRHERA